MTAGDAQGAALLLLRHLTRAQGEQAPGLRFDVVGLDVHVEAGRVTESGVAGFSQVSEPQLMRTPDDGIPRSRFRPPVHVSIWS
nr:hypothetical protein [Nonomuraea aurantiaca]